MSHGRRLQHARERVPFGTRPSADGSAAVDRVFDVVVEQARICARELEATGRIGSVDRQCWVAFETQSALARQLALNLRGRCTALDRNPSGSPFMGLMSGVLFEVAELVAAAGFDGAAVDVLRPYPPRTLRVVVIAEGKARFGAVPLDAPGIVIPGLQCDP